MLLVSDTPVDWHARESRAPGRVRLHATIGDTTGRLDLSSKPL